MDDEDRIDPIWLLKDRQETVIDTPGKQITWHATAFRLTADERLKAATSGPPAWSIRLKRIEEWHRHLENALRERAAELRAELGEGRAFGQRWEAVIDAIDLRPVNTLIDHHNRYYPTEANLPIDVVTRKVMNGAEPFQPKPEVSRAWLRERYPAAWALSIEAGEAA